MTRFLRRTLVLCLIPCSLSLPAHALPQGWTTDGGSKVDIPEGEAGSLSPDELATLVELLIEEAVEPDGPGMALALMLDGELIFAGARGMADLERSVACDVDTAFDMASVSKSVTAAAIAVLVEDGRVDPDARVHEYLPGLSETYRPVQVKDLIHHTGGVEDVEGSLALAGWGRGDPGTIEDALRVLSGLQHLRFEPGTAHIYSNGGYVLLAEIVRAVTGTSLPEFAREHFFEPLGMKSARFATGGGELVPGRALPYGLEEDAHVSQPLSARYGAGGLLCSVVDLAKWADALRTGHVIGADVRDRMRALGTLDDGTTVDYAFGLSRSREGGRELWSHGGSVPGGQSHLSFYPDEGLVIVAASNTLEEPNVGRMAADVAVYTLGPGEEPQGGLPSGMIFIPENQETPPESVGVDVDPGTLASYAGTYEMEDGFLLMVGSRDRQLLIGFDDEPTIEVFPLPDGGFLLPSANYEYHFGPEEDAVTMHVRRSVRTGEPLDVVGRRRRLVPLDEGAAAQLEGTYRSAELGAFYTVEWEDGELWLVHARHGRLLLGPMNADTYSLPGRALARLAFVREEGVVRGFELVAFSWAATSYFSRL